ncbi:recombinase family protein [Hydrogenoanaerobacterium sp.]|uniref:recombinase family protein n=1 Tax=Hydrogenoanaerobacterium sp. TaxID=2953763 RepID=UPI0028978362|nr:recombinase family protein [Hydrogenoanaerobacterium sp.]
MDAIYTRQSVEKKDSLSIEGQIELCARECRSEYTVYADKGYSGKNTNRPDFERMMEDIIAGKISKVVVYRLDRFSRSISDFGQIWNILQKHNVEFISINEKFDTSTPMGRAMLHIIMVFAQLERETIAERIKDNYYQRAKHGSWLGGPAPFGFTIERTSENGKSVPILAANDDIAVVKRIFKEYAQPEMSLGKLARMLTNEGIPCMQRKHWDNVSLSRIFHNPCYVCASPDVYLYYKHKGVNISDSIEDFTEDYAGMLVGKRDRAAGKYTDISDYHFSLANHKGVIPAELWLQCQYKLDLNRQIKNSGKGKYTWLSGLLKCGSCGYGIKISNAKDKLYLRCSGRTNYSVCSEKFVLSIAEIEAAVGAEIEALLSGCRLQQSAVVPPADSDSRATLALIEDKIERLLSALTEANHVSMKYINKELGKLDTQKKELLKSLTEQAVRGMKHELKDIVFSQLDFEEKKVVAARLIEKVILHGEDIEIVWKV